MTLAKSEAKILRDKISDKHYNDEEVIRILTTRSKAQLNATLNHYNTAFGNAINKVFILSMTFSGFLQKLCESFKMFLFLCSCNKEKTCYPTFLTT